MSKYPGKMRCERVISKTERVFVLSNRQNIRVVRQGGKWRSVETNRTYRDLGEIRRIVGDFEDKWSRRIQPGGRITGSRGLPAVMSAMGSEAETVFLQDGWREERGEPLPKSRGHRADYSATANYSVPLCAPHESRQKIESGEKARLLIEEFHMSDKHRAEGGCNYCQ